jgi:hypothetical protein
MWMPMAVVLFELLVNRIEMKPGHVSYQIIMWVAYAFATGLGEALQSYPVFPNSFDWKCGNDCWNLLLSTLLYMLGL